MIDGAIKRLLDDDALDSVFVAYPTHKNFWRRIDGEWVRLASDLAYGPRQTREPLYREDTGFACATRARVIRQGKRVGEKVDIIVNGDEASFIDIHDEFDFWLAERVLLDWGKTIND